MAVPTSDAETSYVMFLFLFLARLVIQLSNVVFCLVSLCVVTERQVSHLRQQLKLERVQRTALEESLRKAADQLHLQERCVRLSVCVVVCFVWLAFACLLTCAQAWAPSQRQLRSAIRTCGLYHPVDIAEAAARRANEITPLFHTCCSRPAHSVVLGRRTVVGSYVIGLSCVVTFGASCCGIDSTNSRCSSQ